MNALQLVRILTWRKTATEIPKRILRKLGAFIWGERYNWWRASKERLLRDLANALHLERLDLHYRSQNDLNALQGCNHLVGLFTLSLYFPDLGLSEAHPLEDRVKPATEAVRRGCFPNMKTLCVHAPLRPARGVGILLPLLMACQGKLKTLKLHADSLQAEDIDALNQVCFGDSFQLQLIIGVESGFEQLLSISFLSQLDHLTSIILMRRNIRNVDEICEL